jgi:hypothetical protein
VGSHPRSEHSLALDNAGHDRKAMVTTGPSSRFSGRRMLASTRPVGVCKQTVVDICRLVYFLGDLVLMASYHSRFNSRSLICAVEAPLVAPFCTQMWGPRV